MTQTAPHRRLAWTLGAFVTGLGVALGAFGSHGLERIVSDPHLRDVWETGVRYHLLHGLALLLCGAHPRPPKGVLVLFGLGIVLFSGSLYGLSLSGIGVLGAITPLGGSCFLGGWGWLAAASWRLP